MKENESREFEENQKFAILQSRLQNVPVYGWLSLKDIETSKKRGCSIYPDILNDIKFRNTYWQIYRNYGFTFHLYRAFFGK